MIFRRRERFNSSLLNLIFKVAKNSTNILFHKSSCITCKRTIEEVDRLKMDIQKRDFFKEPFSESELKKILKLAEKTPKEILRKRDKMYKEFDLENKEYSNAELIKLMIKNPGLIQRPIIVKNNKVIIGKSSIKELK